jgi:hypothetical protein
MLDNELRVGKSEGTSLADFDRIDPTAVPFLKGQLIPVIMQVDDKISQILEDVVELIARDAYDKNWLTLLPDLCKALSAEDPLITLKVF